MDTRLINSQFISKKEILVWFWDGEREYRGHCVEMAENGLIFHAAAKAPGARTMGDAASAVAGIRRLLQGKKVIVELSSAKTKGEVKLRFQKIDPVIKGSSLFAVEAIYEDPPDPGFLKMLLEPVLVRRKKD